MKKIHLLLPTRSRPDDAKNAILNAKSMADHPDRVKIALRYDNDDPLLSSYPSRLGDFAIVGPRLGCSGAYNELARTVPGDINYIFSDDQIFQTQGWDTAFEGIDDAREGRPYAFYTNDLRATHRQATHLGVPKSWLNLFGCLWPVPFFHFYSDTWIEDVAKRAGVLHYLDGVVAEHFNRKYTGEGIDETHTTARDPEKMRKDKQLYDETVALRDDWANQIRLEYA